MSPGDLFVPLTQKWTFHDHESELCESIRSLVGSVQTHRLNRLSPSVFALAGTETEPFVCLVTVYTLYS